MYNGVCHRSAHALMLVRYFRRRLAKIGESTVYIKDAMSEGA